MPTTRALIYARISDDKAGAGLGVQRQEDDCRALAESLGWTVVDVLTDNDLSAYSGKRRPGYDTLLERLRAGQADALVIWHNDRLHRSPVELEEFIALVEEHGTLIQTVKAGELDLSTPSGRMVARLLGSVARYEVEHAVEKLKRAREQAAKAGKWVGGRRPFGWESDGMTLRESEALELRRATEAVISGASLRSIAADWKARGIKTTAGNDYQPIDIPRLLLRPRNAGLSVLHGEVVGQGQWQPIVDEEQWRACKAILNDPRRKTSPGRVRRFLGSGLFRCGLCDETMMTSGGRKSTAYTCLPTKHVYRRADIVDELVSATVVKRLQRPDAVELTRPHAPDLSPLYVEAQAIRGRLAELARMFGDGTISAESLESGSLGPTRRLADIERQLDAGQSRSPLGQFDGRDPAVVWDGLDLDRRREVVAALVVVTILPAPRGRPPSWQPGQRYFDPATVRVEARV